jgi:hypothetical protein
MFRRTVSTGHIRSNDIQTMDDLRRLPNAGSLRHHDTDCRGDEPRADEGFRRSPRRHDTAGRNGTRAPLNRILDPAMNRIVQPIEHDEIALRGRPPSLARVSYAKDVLRSTTIALGGRRRGHKKSRRSPHPRNEPRAVN